MGNSQLDRLVGNNGSLPLTGTAAIVPSSNISICALVAGDDGATITTVRLERNGVEYKYSDAGGVFNWDGTTLGSGELIEIPQGFRLKSLTMSAGSMKGILASPIEFDAV